MGTHNKCFVRVFKYTLEYTSKFGLNTVYFKIRVKEYDYVTEDEYKKPLRREYRCFNIFGPRE